MREIKIDLSDDPHLPCRAFGGFERQHNATILPVPIPPGEELLKDRDDAAESRAKHQERKRRRSKEKLRRARTRCSNRSADLLLRDWKQTIS